MQRAKDVRFHKLADKWNHDAGNCIIMRSALRGEDSIQLNSATNVP